LVWKGKHKLDSLPGCNLETTPEGGGRRNFVREGNSDFESDSDDENNRYLDMPPPLVPRRGSESDSDGDDSSYSPTRKSMPELINSEGE
jgi:hypothetical protein